ncbi:hypothetical protein BCV70DRAFT_54341 [Testicularia cyperi]|uniref:Uncharacterized protein n=1 Tax=Testicularia cyperi TaxID=1882483 RepID=A0A317XUE3_9BASI|nr:hypothetical protein BCV70DRAFT_54341 [Testicularia cyperi]
MTLIGMSAGKLKAGRPAVASEAPGSLTATTGVADFTQGGQWVRAESREVDLPDTPQDWRREDHQCVCKEPARPCGRPQRCQALEGRETLPPLHCLLQYGLCLFACSRDSAQKEPSTEKCQPPFRQHHCSRGARARAVTVCTRKATRTTNQGEKKRDDQRCALKSAALHRSDICTTA